MRISDWSSDVCSSDLHERRALFHEAPALAIPAIDRVRPVVHHAEGIPHVALVVDEEAPGIQRTGGNTGDPAVVGVELEQERIVDRTRRSEEHTSELQSLMRISYAVFCLKKKKKMHYTCTTRPQQEIHKNQHQL